ncbi:unnamed protein product [Ceutorhynchus assimilis]|uniref:Uncharacterized protein n=1 Tax=Ceutorhynchus assimilis TaxID=467358 RepID=A0A9N9MP10_9CUCU|nr:unnamed protein product [Ceutorhynchus assimilis]
MALLQEMDKKYNVLIEKYEGQVRINEELRSELKEIKVELNKRDQKEINQNMLIFGIPPKEDEDLTNIVKKVGQELQVDLNAERFTAVRMGKMGGDANKNPVRIRFESIELVIPPYNQNKAEKKDLREV